MAISNLQETLLMYTKYKSSMNKQLASIQMNMISATKKVTDTQMKYNNYQQELYSKYEPDEMLDEKSEYIVLMAQMENELEFELQNIKSWEEQLELDKLNCEARIAEITTHETTVKTMLKNNLKTDFTYGGVGQGS